MGFTSDIILGLEHVYSLRNTHQIASVNMSLGGGRFYSNCDASETAMKAAIDNLRSVGIATVIASGNDGYKDSISSPGCISTAVSVGSTCDSAGGGYCAGVDAIATYSNSASFLSILAPGSFITSSIPGGGLGANWSGTSMATPHVAGAWALMKQKDPTASVATILTALQSTGVLISDTNRITKARIRLDKALSGNAIGLGDAVDNPTLAWSSSGDAQWFPQTTVFNTGDSAARSGAITHYQSSTIQTTVTGPGSLSFFWKVSSESNNDFLKFSIDGVAQGSGISGEQAWAQVTASIAAGSHTVAWTYSKDASLSLGSDAGWLDTVVFAPQNGVTVTATVGTGGTVTPPSQSVAVGSTASFTVTADTGYTANTAVGGTCVAGSWTGSVYKTGAVSGACSVVFTFTGMPVLTGSLKVDISPVGAVMAGARWSIGGAWQPSGTTLNGVVSGSCTISFNTVPGYISPANQNVTIKSGQTITATGAYKLVIGSTGSLTVTLSPAGAVTAGAQWSVDGGTWQASGSTVMGLSAGTHTTSFSAVAGYTSPANKAVTIILGQAATTAGMYTAASGYGPLKVNISPIGAVNAGARWSVDGGTTWRASGDTLPNLPAGSHTVSFNTVAGYTSPDYRVANITNGRLTTATGMYKQHGSLIVNISPVGAVAAGARWSVDGGTTWRDSGASGTLSGLAAGSYALLFKTAVTNYSPPANKIVRITPGRTTTATGVYTSGYTVTAKASSGGSVSPAKKVVTPGSTAWFVLKFNPGYSSAMVGGTCAFGSWDPLTMTYTTGEVTEACLVSLAFIKEPVATTGAATKITQMRATLNGRVNPENDLTTVTFEYGPDENYGSNVSAGVLTGGKPQAVAASVTGLTCGGGTYHFRVVAVNSVNTTYGLDRAFTTMACADSNKKMSPVSDFNGDGKSDILFRDAVTGQTATWMMNGANVTSNALTSMSAGAYTSTSGWQAQGIGDFDGDKKYDLLWRDYVSGELAVWTMNGATVVTSATASVNPGAYTSTTGWRALGIGDFDGDGRSDIFWRDSATGQTAIWFMNGAVVTSGSNTSYRVGTWWQVHGVGDFNGDGKADILWRHAGTGKTAVWLMNGAVKIGGGYTNVQPRAYTSASGWQIQGVGDFNGDGKSDILLRSAETGRMVLWFMNGVKITSSAYTSVDAGSHTSSAGFRVSAIADYNGDGKSDILLRDSATGQTRVWIMKGSQVTSDTATDASPGAYTSSTGWSVVSGETVR
jgi:hypothetical protein